MSGYKRPARCYIILDDSFLSENKPPESKSTAAEDEERADNDACDSAARKSVLRKLCAALVVIENIPSVAISIIIVIRSPASFIVFVFA